MKQERTFRSEAIILSRTDFGEADRLLVMLTPRHGKLHAIAKGARKPTTRKSGHVELYARTDMLLHRGRDLLIISQAEMVESYLPLREDLTRAAYASYAAELLDRFTTDEDAAESAILFDLLDATFKRVCGESDLRIAPDLRIVARFYEMRLLDVVGFRPELTHCLMCGEAITPQAQFFSPTEGGVICPDCGYLRENILSISQPGLHALRVFQREPWARVQALQLNEPLHLEIERIMLSYLIALLEKRLQSVQFIRRLRSGR
ncbi:DNA repair protein RecO [Chloroflexota bacterium]